MGGIEMNSESELQKLVYALREDRKARAYDNRSPVFNNELADVEFIRDALIQAGIVSPPLIRAGRSDKYGQVYVERIGNTGFPDADEPVALIRAQDRLGHKLMVDYHQLSYALRVPPEQLQSVARQVQCFFNWQQENQEKVRTPGTPGKE